MALLEGGPKDYVAQSEVTTEDTVKYSKDNDSIQEPKYATVGSAGFDVSAKEGGKIRPGETVLVGTGLKFEVPKGSFLSIVPRSGLSLKTSLWLRNTPGTLDSDYRGELGLILHNSGSPYKDMLWIALAVFTAVVLYREIDDYLLHVGWEVTKLGIDPNFLSTWPFQWLFSISVPVLVLLVCWNYLIVKRTFTFKEGDRLAQCLLKEYVQADFREVQAHNLSETDRGEGGYGHTGVSSNKS